MAGTSLDLDALYQPVSIVGTPPSGFAWSPDGRRILFLWNDAGASFRDVWSADAVTGEKRRLTFHGQASPAEQGARGVSEAVFLNDEGRFAYVLGGRLHIVDAAGRDEAVERDKRAVRQLALSPDRRHLAFVSGNAVDAGNRNVSGGLLWARPLDARDDGSTRYLAGDRADPKIYVENYQWAAGGRRIAFTLADNRLMPERDILYYAGGAAQNNRVERAFPGEEVTRYTVGVVDVASGTARMFERPNARHHVWSYGLSGRGDRLFVSESDLLANDHVIWMWDTATGKRERFYSHSEPKHLRPDWQVAWAPDDDGLVILTDRDGWLHLYHQKTARSKPRAITSGRWEIASFTVDRDRRDLLFVANKSYLTDRQVYRVPFAGGAVRQLTPAANGSHDPVYSPDHGRIATLWSDDRTPHELMIVDAAQPGTGRRITHSPRPEFARQTWANIGYVEFPSHVDGKPLVGRLSLPANYRPGRRYPLIVGSVYSDSVRNQWGGRTAHPTALFDQYLVSRGYIVLNVNVRGSWGQGREHNQGLHHSYGQADIDDLESGVRHLVAKGYVDPARVGIWGSSYGGLMTLMSLAKKPGVYAAGIAGAPATNVWHAYPSQMWVMGPPEGSDMPARYEAQSALYHVDKIKDPVLLIHGTRDPVVLYSDTVAATERMIAAGVQHELVTLPGANHAWASDNLAQTRFAFRKMADFFDRHLRPGSVAGESE
ncbi:prolyl oligopeptidase family serine peptidase [Sphingomonas baiyangensis]|uniref:S9 family peptidase n=1 Tax=Sphingomonas baiyangensis TaxID=2572576 RepID=A0A4U1L3N6_9SPHN|nr:prolyl oligopeptidase family serine peptidase [Sphingomonas baiyangensis]TKD51094.1 S9 family peptidase [Sphingomonas baiyangensis]